MTRSLAFAALAASLAAWPALAEDGSQSVASAFIAAAQAQDRPAVIRLLDERVSIRFPAAAERQGQAEGQPFVIGYLDGLFHGERAIGLDGGAADRDGAVRFLAHDLRSYDRYAIDIQVKDARVVRVTVARQPDNAGQSAAAP